MTLAVEANAAPPAAAPAKMALEIGPRWLIVAIAFIPALMISAAQIHKIWTTGVFIDTDDAMRMVQVRSWLAGQGWYDLTAYRINPPAGLFMHWSRVIDVPLALLLKFFSLFTSEPNAELLMRITFPLILQVCLIVGITFVAERLEGVRARFPAAILIVLTGMSLVQFQPGRIDHDDAQIVLLVFTLANILRTIEPGRAGNAAIAGVLSAVSLAIGVENVPFLPILLAAVPLAWAIEGDRLRPALLALAGGLLPSLLFFYVATIAPWRWELASCDAYSLFHLVGFGMGGLSCLALVAVSPKLHTRVSRLACCAAAGAFVIIAGRLLFPACFGDPYAGVDPIVRKYWLDNVSEARPLLTLLRLEPGVAPVIILPGLLGLLGILDGVVRSRGAARGRWTIVLATALAGCALSFWEVRALDFFMPVAAMGGVRAAMLVLRGLEAKKARVTFALAVAAVFPFGSAVYALIPAQPGNPTEARYLKDGEACREPQQYTALARLPVGLVLAPVDAGAHLMAYTRDSVIGAPFHRNNAGNRFVIDAFRDSPDAARKPVEAAGVTYVVVCRGFDPAVAKGSLADVLLRGDPPAWLKRAPIPQSRLKVYELQR